MLHSRFSSLAAALALAVLLTACSGVPAEGPPELSAPPFSPSPSAAPSPVPTPEPREDMIVDAEPDPLIDAVLCCDAPLYPELPAESEPEEEPAVMTAGRKVRVQETDDPLWYAVMAPAEDSAAEENILGYLYAECLCRVDENGRAGTETLFLEYARNALEELELLFPAGKYWNHIGYDVVYGDETPEIVTDTPCSHARYGEEYCNFYNGKTAEQFHTNVNECLGFASYLSDRLFGEESDVHRFTDSSLLRVGDHIRLLAYEHSMIVTDISEEGIAVAEVNRSYEDCLIEWGRVLTPAAFSALSWDMVFYSRYPLRSDREGGYIPWNN